MNNFELRLDEINFDDYDVFGVHHYDAKEKADYIKKIVPDNTDKNLLTFFFCKSGTPYILFRYLQTVAKNTEDVMQMLIDRSQYYIIPTETYSGISTIYIKKNSLPKIHLQKSYDDKYFRVKTCIISREGLISEVMNGTDIDKIYLMAQNFI